MSKKITYQQAYSELQDIVAKLQGDDVNLDDLDKYVIRAMELIKICKEKLRTIDKKIDKITGDDLSNN